MGKRSIPYPQCLKYPQGGVNRKGALELEGGLQIPPLSPPRLWLYLFIYLLIYLLAVPGFEPRVSLLQGKSSTA